MNVIPNNPTRGAAVVQSARNGLIVTIPTDARGVIPRFFTQGDNELVFKRVGRQRTKVDTSPAVMNVADEAVPMHVDEDDTLYAGAAEQASAKPKAKRSKLEDLA